MSRIRGYCNKPLLICDKKYLFLYFNELKYVNTITKIKPKPEKITDVTTHQTGFGFSTFF